MASALREVTPLDALWVLLDAWQDHMAARGLSDTTRDQYEAYLVRFLRRARTSPETVTIGLLERFLRGVPAKGSNRAAYVSAFRSFFPFCVREGVIERNPAEGLRIKPAKYPEPDYFEPEEVRRIVISGASRSEKIGHALLLLFETGARIGSLASIEPRDVVGDPPRRLRFRITKGDRPYGVSLTPAASDCLAALLDLMEPGQPTILGVEKTTLGAWFHEAATYAGFPPGRVHAHLARHTAGTMLYRRTKDPMLVKTFLNHADLSQVQRYVRVADEAMDEATAETLTV